MEFINQAVTVLQTLVVALGAGLAVWGVVNLMEGYGNDNPGAKSQGIKQLMAGGGVVLIGTTLIPLLSGCSDTRFACPHGRARKAALSLIFNHFPTQGGHLWNLSIRQLPFCRPSLSPLALALPWGRGQPHGGVRQ